MRLSLRLVASRSGRTDDVVLWADPDVPTSAVVTALEGVQAGPFFADGEELGGDGRLGDTPLRDGQRLGVGAPLPAQPSRTVAQELAVVGGPLAGQAWPVASGTYVVGSGPGADLRLDHSSVAGEHFRLLAEQGLGAAVEPLDARVTAVDGRPLSDARLLRPGHAIQAGACVLELRAAPVADADVSPDGEGGLAFNRPARIRRAPQEVKVTWPASPTEREKYPFPWVQILVPLVLAVLAAYLLERWQFLLFALMSPILAVSNAQQYRSRDAKRSGREAARYETDREAAARRIADAAATETATTRVDFPDPATVAAIAAGPGRRLWERRDGDNDALHLRLGLTDRPAAIEIAGRGDDPPPAPVLPAVPVTVDLAQAGVFGVAGAPETRRAVARWLLGQLAALRSPAELNLVVLTDADAGADFDWLRWVPHARLSEPGAPLAFIGNDKASREERLKELLKLLDVREAIAAEHGGASLTPVVVVLIDGIRALRSLPGVPRLLKDGPRLGLFTIGLDSDATRLAEEGKAEFVLDPSGTIGELRVEGADPVPDILVDQVGTGWADRLGGNLAPLRDGGGEEDTVIPNAVRFVDLAGLELDNPDQVVAGWTLGGRTTEALVGQSIDGPFRLDLKRDGPHGLVAGTTGSGKSEFLQTLVVSLALANRPAAMNFVLVDYKGASAFADCENLPHTVGLVTNLDGHLTERALASLDAELERREHVLRDLGAPDVDGAWQKDPDRAAEAGLARLVLVIDEFAELVQELPDFVSGLIRIARVGRSLGVHLLLATQRPAGVVSAEMRANTGLRVALRMEDKHDSTEVLEAPDAARISRGTPGRGFVRAGGSSSLTQFQTARVAGRRRGATQGVPPPQVVLAPWNRLGYPPPAPPRPEDPEASLATDLHSLVEMVRGAADRLGLAPPRRPWLPPLPGDVVLAELASASPEGPAVYGLEDLPALQKQRTAGFDLVHGGHLIVAGSARTGRSTALRTLAASLARTWSPSDLHLYGLDFGNGALLPLGGLPHCGGVIVRSETDRVERFVARLADEVARRQQLLARHGYGDIAEQRAAAPAGERLPYLVVFLDRWEGFVAQYPPESASEMPAGVVRLVREGLGVGLRMVLAGDRTLLTDRVASLVDEKLVLRLTDRSDYRIVNLTPRAIPEEMAPGRAVRGESGNEVQIALLATDPSGQAQAEAVRTIADEAAVRWPASERLNRPFRIDALPSTVTAAEAAPLVEAARTDSPLWAMVGVGGDELTAFGVDLGLDVGFVVAGSARSGRSTAAFCLARSLLAGGAEVAVVCPRPSPLSGLAGTPGIMGVWNSSATADELTAALQKASGPVAIVIDDAESYARSEGDEAIKAFLKARGPGQTAIIVAGQIEEMKNELRGCIVEAKKAKAGLLLSPGSTLDGELVGLRLPRNLVGRTPPGRGVMALHGQATVVQVPL